MAEKSLTRTALATPETMEAYQALVATFVETLDANKAWDAMMMVARKNGALQVAQTAVIIDILKLIADALSSNNKARGR